jgi:hypothetical protein
MTDPMTSIVHTSERRPPQAALRPWGSHGERLTGHG